MKENIAVIFGGKSAEHDISIITGLQAISNLDREKFNVVPIYIDKSNKFYAGEKLCYLENYMPFNPSHVTEVSFISGEQFLFAKKRTKNIFFVGEKSTSKIQLNKKVTKASNVRKMTKLIKIDCVINCCHGKFGEDGALAGLLAISGIPITSCELFSSANCMDKIFMKDILQANNILSAKYLYFEKIDYILKNEEILAKIDNEIGYPLFVKPSRLGSSIGISKCYNQDELEVAIEVAMQYDNRILIEKSIENNIEINCAVIGDENFSETSKIEFPNKKDTFLTFNEKYIQRKEAANEKFSIEKIVSEEIEEKIKEIALEAFKKFNCKGVVRIDFLYSKTENEVYLNEINTIPGSLAFYLFKEKYDFAELLTKLVNNAIKHKIEDEKLESNFKSDALKNFNSGLKSNK